MAGAIGVGIATSATYDALKEIIPVVVPVMREAGTQLLNDPYAVAYNPPYEYNTFTFFG